MINNYLYIEGNTWNYWPSSQKRKALFSTRKKAEEAVKRIDDNTNIEIVEL